MSLKLIEKNCVRISIEQNGQITNQGSGVVVSFSDKYYVLTAYHCIGTNDISEIIVENQSTYNSDPYKIEIIDIVKFDENKDWILLEIKDDENFETSTDSKVAKNFISDEEIKFCGYQNINKKEFRPWKGKILNTSDSNFKLTIVEDTLQQGGEDGKYFANGLSGSGVYLIKDGKPFLIGILNSVKTEKAFNDDFDCCSISCLQDLIKDYYDLSDTTNLKKWAQDLENKSANDDVEEWKELNIEEFENIDRKNKVIYEDKSKADKITSKQIRNFLSTNQKIDNLNNFAPELYLAFKNLVLRVQTMVEDDFSRTVNNGNDAKDVKIELQKYLQAEIKEIFTDEMSVKFKLAEYQIINWLMDCSLNFTKND